MSAFNTVDRRRFLGTAGLGLAALAWPRGAFGFTGPVRRGRLAPPDRKLNIACIGCGGQGGGDLRGLSGENIVALCDVDSERARDAFTRYGGIPHYSDFRRMLLEMDEQIDAVSISTPDHMHFAPAMMAITMGKHVRVQKPLTHTIWEARQLTAAARRHGVVTQMGNQGHAGEGIRLMVEWVRAGVIGDVREAHIWTNRPIWPQGKDALSKVWPAGERKPAVSEDPPVSLDWNDWLGTTPRRPYNPAYLPFNWRGWWDFGCGALGDMGCHIMDACFWALNLGSPSSVEAESAPVNDQTAPEWSIVTYRFPARGTMPPVTVKWFDGRRSDGSPNLPPRPPDLEPERRLSRGGQVLYGEHGTIMDTSDYCRGPRLVPESRMRDFSSDKRPPKRLPRVPNGVYREWIDACKGGPAPGSNFDYAGPLTEMVLLGNLAIRLGKPLEWDAAALRCPNAPEADALIRRGYRNF